MRVTVSGSGALVVLTVLFLAGVAAAQAPPSVPPPAAPLPSPGFVPPYEIMRTVRAAGFDPLAPPLREGTTYVLRATDFNGILMRVVVDARTGAIRDANRIVPGPGNFGAAGQLGMAVPTELPSDIVPDADGPPRQFAAPEPAPVLQPTPPPLLRPPPKRHAKHVAAPLLPGARPAKLAARKSGGDGKPASADHRTSSPSAGAQVAAPAARTAKPDRTPPAIND